MKHELSKLTISSEQLKRAKSVLADKELKYENGVFKQNVVKRIPITNISKFAEELVLTTLNFLPENQKNDLKTQLKNMEFSAETQPKVEEVKYSSEEWKSFYGCLFATKDKGSDTITVAYCFGTLEFKLKSGAKVWLLKKLKGNELTQTQIEDVRTVYCRYRFLKHSKENGLIEKVNLVD